MTKLLPILAALIASLLLLVSTVMADDFDKGIQLVDEKYSLAKKLPEMRALYERTVSSWRGRT